MSHILCEDRKGGIVPMDNEMLKLVIDYKDVFNIIANGKRTIDEIAEELKSRGTNPTTITRRKQWLLEKPVYMTVRDGEIAFDTEKLKTDLMELQEFVLPREDDNYIEDEGNKNRCKIEGDPIQHFANVSVGPNGLVSHLIVKCLK